MEFFKKDPVNVVLYVLSMEKQKTNGLEMAQKAYDHYFVNKENDDIVTQYGEVSFILNVLANK